MGKTCPCLDYRKSAFIVGVFNLIFGLAYLTTVIFLFGFLSRESLWNDVERNPRNGKEIKLAQLLIFYSPAGGLVLILGILLSIGAFHRDYRFIETAFCVSLIFLFGVPLEVIGLKIYGISWLAVIPLLLLCMGQLFFFFIITDYRNYLRNDSQLLVVKTSMERQRLHEDSEPNEAESSGVRICEFVDDRI